MRASGRNLQLQRLSTNISGLAGFFPLLLPLHPGLLPLESLNLCIVDRPYSAQFSSFAFVLLSLPSRVAMFRPASRALRAPAFAVRGPVARRFISTAQPQEKSRSWKSTAARLGLAIGAVYYYNTSSVFAQEPSCTCCVLFSLPPSFLLRT